MNKTGFFCRAAAVALFALVLAFVVGAPVVYAQGGAAAEPAAAATPVWHYIGAVFWSRSHCDRRWPWVLERSLPPPRKASPGSLQPPHRSPATVNLPIFLLEGVAILAEVFVLIIVVLK